MFDLQFILKKLSTLTDKFVDEAYYDDENKLNVTLKPEKNLKNLECMRLF